MIQGGHHSPETCAKIAETMKTVVRSPEHRANLSKVKMGDRNPSKRLEVREKIRAAFTPEKRAAISESLRGHAVSEATRAKIREARLMQQPQPNAGSQPEQLMAAILEWAGVEFHGQRRIGRYMVDFYLPATTSVVEVDGAYWHRTPRPERDAYLLEHGVAAVHHITDTRLKEHGWL